MAGFIILKTYYFRIIIKNLRNAKFANHNLEPSSCSSVIDHAYINSTSLSQVSSFIVQEDISDHLPVGIKYQCNFNRNTKRPHYRKTTQEGLEFFLEHLNDR